MKVTANINPQNYLSVRYGRNENSQPYGADAAAPPSGWGDSKNKFNSINVNHNTVLGGSTLNEFIFQYADFGNNILPHSPTPRQTFPNGVTVGQNPNTPQTTQQKKWQFRDDFSWTTSGMGGIGHAFKAGVNWIHEPHAVHHVQHRQGRLHVHAPGQHARTVRSATVTRNGGAAARTSRSISTRSTSRTTGGSRSRLTINVGLRYDVIDGFQIDQSRQPELREDAGRGRAPACSTGIKGLENFGKEPKEDTNNWQPRIGFAYDLRGDGKDVIRGGWGIYQDVGYTNSNVLFPAIDATGRFGRGVQRRQPARHPQPRRQLLSGRPAALEHRQPEPGEPECAAALRAVAGSAPRRCRTRGRPRSAGRTS